MPADSYGPGITLLVSQQYNDIFTVLKEAPSARKGSREEYADKRQENVRL